MTRPESDLPPCGMCSAPAVNATSFMCGSTLVDPGTRDQTLVFTPLCEHFMHSIAAARLNGYVQGKAVPRGE